MKTLNKESDTNFFDMEKTMVPVNYNLRYTHDKTNKTFDTFTYLAIWAKSENRDLINGLPHLGAVIEFWELVTAVYDMARSCQVIKLIENGNLDFQAWNEFVAKFSLEKKGWPRFRFNITEHGRTVLKF